MAGLYTQRQSGDRRDWEVGGDPLGSKSNVLLGESKKRNSGVDLNDMRRPLHAS